MAEWDQVKIGARGVVQGTFARSAVYRTTPSSPTGLDVKARLHTKQQVIGDLDREGFAQVLQDVNAIVLDLEQVQPVKGATVTFVSDGRAFTIEHIQHSDDGRYVKCEVSPRGR